MLKHIGSFRDVWLEEFFCTLRRIEKFLQTYIPRWLVSSTSLTLP